MSSDSNIVYLVKVEPNANNNKYYRMINLDSEFKVEYGRVGTTGLQTRTYPIGRWNSKFKEKIRKGYVDQTRLVANIIDKETNEYKEIDDLAIKIIIDRLQTYSKKAISKNYTISSTNVTQIMIDEAQLLIDEIKQIEDVDDFNKNLVVLFQTIPRKMRRVSDYLIKAKEDIEKIIENEQDLLDIMRGQVVQNVAEVNETVKIHEETILDKLGIEIIETTDEEVKLIKEKLGEISDKYCNSWRVINKKTQKKFNDFKTQESIKNIKLLWHGSRNENWISIMQSGLLLRPNAIISGKMFGNGIYFAPRSRKSLGYTSLSGSYWVGGNSNSAFMALKEVAYGIPYDAYSFDSKFCNLSYDKLQNYKRGSHSLHAHAGSMLRNDEIIVYKEEQVNIKYLVELK